MLCRSLARPSRGGEEEGWHWGHWGRSICSPNQPVSSSHPNPGKVDLFWIRESDKILVREHERAAKDPRDHRAGGWSPSMALPHWCHLHLPYHILHVENPKCCYSEVTQPLLQLCWLGRAGLGLCPSTALPQPVEP